MPELLTIFTSPKTLHVLKILLILMALYTFVPLSNMFKPKAYRASYSKNEFLFFSNIAMLYTVLGVVAGYLRPVDPMFGSVHRFVIPTATVLEAVVALIFWGLFVGKRELVIRTNSGPGLWPVLHECPKHLFPLVILGMEHYGGTLQKTHSQRVFLVLFCVLYYCVSEALIRLENNYLYPFLEHLPHWARALLFLSVMAISFVVYEVLLEPKNKLYQPGILNGAF